MFSPLLASWLLVALGELGVSKRLFGGNGDAWTYLTIAILLLFLSSSASGSHKVFRCDGMAEAFSPMHHFLPLCSDGADASISGRRVCYQARHYDRNSSETPPAPEQSSPQSSRSRQDLVGALATIVLCFVTTIASVLQILDLLNLLEMG